MPMLTRERLTLLWDYKRPFLYSLIFFMVATGHYFAMQMPLEPFRYIRQSVMSMLCLICIIGAVVLISRKKGSRADALFAFLMFMIALTNMISLIRGFTTGYAGVVGFTFMSFPMLVYGSVYAFFFLLYPIEAFRPGWLSLKRAFLLFLPTLVILGVYLLATRIFGVTVPVMDDWNDLTREFWNITVWLRLFVLFYPLFGLIIMLRYRKNYRAWSENNYASLEHINVQWLVDYIFANFMITFSCLVIVFSNNPRTVLVHNIIFLLFFIYGFYRVYFQENPYPEGYFKASMNEEKAEIWEIIGHDKVSHSGDCENEMETETELTLTPLDEPVKTSLFTIKLPEYKMKLEQWMESEKPYLRKDFKLTDAMEILPLNRSYLSRLFNEGYGESFYHFVMRYRIEESKQLLLSRPDLSITAIAAMTGFSSPPVFCRAFTQEMKCSPMQWRERELTSLL